MTVFWLVTEPPDPPVPRPTGADAVRRAVVEAAAERFAVEGPDASLRDIADDANVNLGLIHRYIGTKDALIRAVLQHELAMGAGTITGARDAGDAVTRMFAGAPGGRRYIRIVAGLLLKDPVRFRHQDEFPGMQLLRSLPVAAPEGGSGDPPEVDATERDTRLMLAMAALYGWTVFGPQLRASFGQEDTDEAVLRERFSRALVTLLAQPGGEG